MSESFSYAGGQLRGEQWPVASLADEFGTPLYVYSAGALRRNYGAIVAAFADFSPAVRVCYSVKANSNLSVLATLKEVGAGFDIVSAGELARVQAIGADPARVVFAGVGKREAELRAALTAKIGLFNVESGAELARLDAAARALDTIAPVALRLNPDVDPETHTYITTGVRENKFGIDLRHAEALVERFDEYPHVRLAGVHVHLGSQVFEARPYLEALDKVLPLITRWRARHELRLLNLGGGFGVRYEAFPGATAPETAPGAPAGSPLDFDVRAYARLLRARLAEFAPLGLVLEPGRAIAANAGLLVTTVTEVKRSGDKAFVIVDAGMNDLIRPSLYGAFHAVWPVIGRAAHAVPGADRVACDVVGPICESGDFLARDWPLPVPAAGDRLAVFHAGAYGFSMASQYNSRGRPAEVLVDGAEARLVRRRETHADLLALERECLRSSLPLPSPSSPSLPVPREAVEVRDR